MIVNVSSICGDVMGSPVFRWHREISEMEITVEFAPIDARDGICGYDTVAFVDPSYNHTYEINGCYTRCKYLNREAFVLGQRMQREYLTRLYALQQEIKIKYEAELVNLPESSFSDDYEQRNDLEDAIYETVKRQVELEFPGNEAEYYT
jgi:hypothetical protein